VTESRFRNQNAGSKKRREAERSARRTHLLAAAERVFGRRQFDEASMQQIASEAGIGMQGLYGFFPSKQKLYEEVIHARLDEIDRQAREAFAQDDPYGRLRALAVVYSGFFLEAPQFFPLWASHKLSHDWGQTTRFGSSIHRRVADQERRLERALLDNIKAGVLREIEPALLTGLATSIFNAVVQYEVRRGQHDAVACADKALEQLLWGAGVRP
jgi:AcrR family transcriptional regulator